MGESSRCFFFEVGGGIFALRRPRPYSRGVRGVALRICSDVARRLPPKEVVEELGEPDAEAAYPDGQADGRPLDAVHQTL